MQPPPPPPQQQPQRQYHLNHHQQQEQNARQKMHLQQQISNAPSNNNNNRAPLRLISGSNANNVVNNAVNNPPQANPQQAQLQQLEIVKKNRRSKRPTLIMRAGPKDEEPQIPKVVEPCGVLGEFGPGIIRRIRDGEHIRYVLGTFAGLANLKRPRSFSFPDKAEVVNKKQRENPEGSLSLEGMFRKEEDTLDTASCPKIDPDDLDVDEQVLIDKDKSASVEIARMSPADQYRQLIFLDLKGRRNALKRSRRRVTTAMVMKDDILGSIARNYKLYCVPTSENEDPVKLKREFDLQMGKWKALFATMDKALGLEEHKLVEIQQGLFGQ